MTLTLIYTIPELESSRLTIKQTYASASARLGVWAPVSAYTPNIYPAAYNPPTAALDLRYYKSNYIDYIKPDSLFLFRLVCIFRLRVRSV